MKCLKLFSMTMLISVMMATPAFAIDFDNHTDKEDININNQTEDNLTETILDGDMHDGTKTATVVDESLKDKEALAHYEAAKDYVSGIFNSIKCGDKSFKELSSDIKS